MKKLFLIILCMLIVILPLAGCNKDNEDSGSKISFSFWNPLTGADGPIMRQLIDKFNLEYKDTIEVIPSAVNATSHYDNLINLVPQNKGPDLALIHADRLASFAYRNLLNPMEDIINSSDVEFNTDDYIQNVINSLYYDNKLYGIPLDVHVVGLYYNKTLLGSRPVPTNRQELINTAKAFQSENPGLQGLPLSTVWPSEWLFTTSLFQNGGKDLSDNDMPAFNNEAGENALRALTDLIHVEKISAEKLSLDQDLSLFKQGKALFHMQGCWMLESIKEAGFEFGVIPLSSMFTSDNNQTKNQIAARSHVFTLPTKRLSKARQAAIIEFVSWIGRNSASWAAAGQIPAFNSTRSTEEYLAIPHIRDFGDVENFNLGKPSPYYTEGYNPVFARVTTAMLKSDSNAKTLLTDAETEAVKLVNEAKQY